MDGFSVLDFTAWEPQSLKEHPAYPIGNALGWLYRGNKQASTDHPLSGRLYLAKSGWLLLSVPNALVRGVYDAIAVPGAELPLAGHMKVPNAPADLLNAHISVMNADEVASIGADKITERGHSFRYSLGAMTEIDIKKNNGVEKVWVIKVISPELSALRKTYGLPALLNDNHAFHITVAVRRRGILRTTGPSKGGEPQQTGNSGSFDNATGRGELKAAAADPVRDETPHKTDKLSRAGQKDLLPGGEADNLPDREFSAPALAEGAKHEHEHTNNDQIAKEIAKDHLQEDPAYYKKVKEIEKEGSPASPYQPYKSVYMQEMLNHFNRRMPLVYDHNKPVFQNIRDQLMEIKNRGDFILRTQRNYEIYKSQVDPVYRNQIGLQAMRGESPMPSFTDRIIDRYGDNVLASLGGGK